MVRVGQVLRSLGVSGAAFLLALALYSGLYLTGRGLAAFLTLLLLFPLAAIVAFRALRFIRRNALWSVRNRLLFVYGLMGVLPILLLFVLLGLSILGLINNLAIYLANTALERRLDPINGTVEGLARMPPEQHNAAAEEMQKAFQRSFPGITIYIKDETGEHCYPAGSPALDLPAGWKDANGLLFWHNRFYGWAHSVNQKADITAVAPLSNEFIEELIPNLGLIALIENKGSAANFDIGLSAEEEPASAQSTRHRPHLPPSLGTFDIPVSWGASIPHYHLDEPNKTHDGILWVRSRPSAVLATFFARAESFGGTLSLIFIVVAMLFLVVELVALFIGISLSHRLTNAVNHLYEGTRRVLMGDFRHRIPVFERDQLGELGESFNRMTSNLERLFVVEKEKERLQTEVEIAREVQSQLYPKEAPPTRGLKLTVCCDPARMVSGDYYDYQEISSDKLAFAIGDVAGKGISAALLMATLQAALRAQLSQYLPIVGTDCSDLPEIETAMVVSKLNKQLYAHTSPEKYATFFFAMFDENTRVMTYTNAGHLSPMLFRGNDVALLDSNGTVVGAFPFSKYETSCVTLEPGDLLVCYTDGITEPENPYGEMFGEERLIDLVKKHKHQDDHEILRIILEAVKSWTGIPELHDDMTLLLAREVQTA